MRRTLNKLLPIRGSAALAALLLALPPAAGAGAEPSARELMEQVTETRKLDGSEAVVSMTIATAQGQTRERKLSMATKLADGGKTEKRVYRFSAPADVAGTGVLVFDYEAQADDVWVYLPALRKIRRIVSAQRSEGFMGSEFSYADLNVPALDDYNYRREREESVGGEACHVIDVLPKTPEIAKGEGYSRKTYWVSRERFVLHKAVYYDLEGRAMKELDNSDFKLLDAKRKRYRPMRMVMTNKQNGRVSTFATEQIAFSPEVKDDYFTPRQLERP
ncbi:MAG: outer membrane lipoprotein-sorting protein [Deltaproteobacteria bacterium]